MSATAVAWILAAGAATSLGGLGVLVLRRPSARGLDLLLGFTAGVMLAATAFSLLVPAVDRGALWEVLLGFVLGGAAVGAADRFLPHLHLGFFEAGHTRAEAHGSARRRAGLLLSALTIHNVPEGMAVGVAFAAGGAELGVPIALAIGVQNVPEGFAAASPLVGAGTTRRAAAVVAALTGLVEPPAAFGALAAFELADGLLTGGLAFAAGAMLYVVADELIPESHARGHEREATLGLFAGFALMMALDNAFA